MRNMQPKKKINKWICILLLLLPSVGHAQESFLDVKIGFGSYTLDLKYLFKGAKAPYDGYLLQTHDIAILKIDLDSYKTDCEDIVYKASLEGLADLKKCNEDAEDRFLFLFQENEQILESLNLLEESLKVQKVKTFTYTMVGSATAIALTAGYFLFIK